MLVTVSMEPLRRKRRIFTFVLIGALFFTGMSSLSLNSVSGSEVDKTIYLTFDDGPHPIFTPLLLSLLEEHGVKATFFPIGHRLEERWLSDDLNDLLNRGHLLGNHSWTHRELTKQTQDDLYYQLNTPSELIENMTGFRPNCFRAPFGDRNYKVLTAAEELGMKHVDWSIDPQEWREPKIEEAMEHISERYEDGAILLLHDRTFLSLPILKEVLERFPSSEWSYKTIPECMVNEEKKVRSSTREKGDIPIGNVKNVFKIDETLRVSGWAYDPDAPNGGLKIKHSGKTGEVKSLGQTNLNHEFSFDISDFDVDTPVCLWIENEGLARHNTFLGCHNATFG